MEDWLLEETRQLAASWMKHDRAMLRDYLVEDVEDPRINVQSILTRHFLIDQLFPGAFRELMEHELRYSAILNWGLALHKKSIRPDVLQALLNALLMDEEEIEGVHVPVFVRQAFAMLPAEADGVTVPDYLSELLLSPAPHPTVDSLPEPLMRTFARLWSAALSDRTAPPSCSVLEPACGSANDYRFIETFGLGGLIDYTGFDLCDKNIANARQMFPEVAFRTGNVLAIDAPDKSCDLLIAHDLFEHLSIEAMHVAVAEACRVTRRALCIGFFNLHDGPEHEVKQVDAYHWNRLSVPRLTERFAQHGGRTSFIHIDTLLRDRFDYPHTHNKGAYTAVVTLD